MHGGIKQTPLSFDSYSSTGSSTTRERLSRAAFVDSESNMRSIDNLHKSGIHPVGEARVILDRGTKCRHWRVFGRLDSKDRVRISHGHSTYLKRLATDLKTIGVRSLGCIERETAGLEIRDAHVDGYDIRTLHPRMNQTGRTIEGHCAFPSLSASV